MFDHNVLSRTLFFDIFIKIWASYSQTDLKIRSPMKFCSRYAFSEVCTSKKVACGFFSFFFVSRPKMFHQKDGKIQKPFFGELSRSSWDLCVFFRFGRNLGTIGSICPKVACCCFVVFFRGANIKPLRILSWTPH